MFTRYLEIKQEENMKTPEEILRECTVDTVYSTYEKIKQLTAAMKIYANQKLEEAKYNVSLRETNEYTTPDTETGFCDGIAAAMESIEILKESI